MATPPPAVASPPLSVSRTKTPMSVVASPMRSLPAALVRERAHSNNEVVVVPPLPVVSAPAAPVVVPHFPQSSSSSLAVEEVLRAPPSAAPLKSYESEGLVDEKEIMNIGNQTWRALGYCGELVVPLFLAITLWYYALGKYTGSQSVAAVGIVFASFLVMIMGSYILAVIPFILLSRMFTCMVSDTPLTMEEQRETNLYARMFLFFTLLAGIALIFTHI